MVTFLDGGTPVITGTDTITTPGGYQFAVTGGNGPYTWSVTGTGVSINSSGYVTLDGACGIFTVSCTDCTGRSVQHTGTMVTNNGAWAGNEDLECNALSDWQWNNVQQYIQGRYLYKYVIWCSVLGPSNTSCCSFGSIPDVGSFCSSCVAQNKILHLWIKRFPWVC